MKKKNRFADVATDDGGARYHRPSARVSSR
jgi:hypothetical protein